MAKTSSRRWWFLAAAIAALLLVAAGAAVWRVVETHAPAFTRERVEAGLTAALGRPVRVERMIVRPWVGRVGLAGVTVAAGPTWDAGPALVLRRAEATVGISSLWRRELVISRVALEDVQVRHTTEPGGEPLTLPVAIPDRVVLGPVTAVIQLVEVRGAHVRYEAAAGEVVELEGLRAAARPREGGLDLEASAATVRLQRPGLEEMFQALEGSGRLRGDLLTIESLTGRWGLEELAVSGEVGDLGATPRLALRVQGRVPLKPLAERAGAPWPVEGLARVDASVDGPVTALAVAGRVDLPTLVAGPVSARRVGARVEWRDGEAQLSDVSADAFGGRVDGAGLLVPTESARTRVTFRATGVSLEALEAVAGQPLGLKGEVTLEGEVRGDVRRLAGAEGWIRFEAPQVALPGEAGRLGEAAIGGEARLAGGAIEVVRAEGRWAAARVELTGRIGLDGALALNAAVTGDAGRVARAWGLADVTGQASVVATLRGRWDAPDATGQARSASLVVGAVRVDRLSLPFRVVDRTLHVDGAEGLLGQSKVEVRGTAAWTGPLDAAHWQERVQARLDVRARSARAEDLAVWIPADWPASGRFELTGRVDGTPAAWSASGVLADGRLVVRGHPVEVIRAPFTLSPAAVDLRGLRARVAGVPVAGNLGWRWESRSGTARLDLGPAALAAVPAVAPELAPTGTARGRIDATVRDGVVSGTGVLTGENVALPGLALTLGRGTLQVSLREGRLEADLAFPGTGASGTARGRVEAGEPIDVRLRVPSLEIGPLVRRWLPEGVAGAIGPVEGAVAADLELRIPFWDPVGARDGSAELRGERLALAGVELGRGTARATLDGGDVRIAADLPEVRASATAAGRVAPGAVLQVEAEVRDLAVEAVARRWLPDPLPHGVGPLGGSVTATASLAVPVDAPADARGTVRLEPLRLTVAGEEWRAREPVLVRREPRATRVERARLQSRLGRVTVAGEIGDDGRVNLDAEGRMPLALLPVFRPEIREAAGTLDARVAVRGTTASPEVTGEGEIRDGRVAFAAYPDPLRAIHARFRMSPAGLQVREAVAALGAGKLSASGDIAFREAAVGGYRFTVTARQVPLSPLPDLVTTWDADLELVGLSRGAQLRGEARLRRGLYTRDFSLLRLLLERRVEAAAATDGGIHLDLRLALQDNLVVRTPVARFRAGGLLSVQGTTGRPAVFGAIEVRDGQLTFRRQRFTITAASARFTDPRRIDPFLDVRATSRIRDHDITLHLTGRSENLEVRFTSSPPLPEEDVLSLVAFGVTREQLGRTGAGLLVGELAGVFVQELFGLDADTAGLDVLEVEPGVDGDAGALRVGKRLTARTLVVYSQGLDDAAERRLRIEYQVVGPLVVAGEQDFRGGFGADVLVRLRFR